MAKKAKAKNPVGRPEIFTAAIGEKIIELAKAGKTHKQTADIIGVHVRTLEYWLKNKQELLWSVRENKQLADEIVEASLYAKATGYSHEAVKIFCSKDGEVTEVPYIEHHPPDTQAAQFWLKNRQPDKWREKSEVETKGAVTITVTQEDLEDRINKIKDKT